MCSELLSRQLILKIKKIESNKKHFHELLNFIGQRETFTVEQTIAWCCIPTRICQIDI